MPTSSLLSLQRISALPGAGNKSTAPPPPDDKNFYFSLLKFSLLDPHPILSSPTSPTLSVRCCKLYDVEIHREDVGQKAWEVTAHGGQ